MSGIDNQSPLHREFLDTFFEEEFDADTALESTQKRAMIPRRKIRAHNTRVIADIPGSPFDPSRTIELVRTINKAYSGSVHAASPHIMELYGSDPPRFHMSGMLGTRLEQSHWRIFGITSTARYTRLALSPRHSAMMFSGTRYATMQGRSKKRARITAKPMVVLAAPLSQTDVFATRPLPRGVRHGRGESNQVDLDPHARLGLFEVNDLSFPL